MYILFFWENIHVLRRGDITAVNEMIFEKLCFCPLTLSVLRPSRFLVTFIDDDDLSVIPTK